MTRHARLCLWLVEIASLRLGRSHPASDVAPGDSEWSKVLDLIKAGLFGSDKDGHKEGGAGPSYQILEEGARDPISSDIARPRPRKHEVRVVEAPRREVLRKKSLAVLVTVCYATVPIPPYSSSRPRMCFHLWLLPYQYRKLTGTVPYRTVPDDGRRNATMTLT